MDRGGTAAPSIVGDTDAWARDAFRALAQVPGSSRAGLALSAGGGRQHRFTADDRDAEGVRDWCAIDAYEDVPLNHVARTGEPVFGSLDQLEERYPAFVARQRRTPYVAFAAVPFVAAGQTLGGFVLYFDSPQPFPDRQRAGLSALGERLGAGLRRVQVGEGRAWASLGEEPAPPGARVSVHQVPPDLSAVAGARAAMVRALRGWDVEESTMDTAVLCLSELVTNALIHTGAGAEVRFLLDDGVLTTTVRDGGRHAVLAEDPGEDPLRARGRGLQIVDALADRWGSRLDSVGTTVWFVLEC